VFSDDNGMTWRQSNVPTSESLTAVTFPSPQAGWAVGHSGVVLHTEDGGETWTRQLDGKVAAELALEGARAYAAQNPSKPAAKQAVTAAEQLVADGPDKPFLALYFANEQTGFVAGAYGVMFRTDDGGKSWKSWMDRLDNPKGLHINAMKAFRDNVYLAGEEGLFLRSTDKANTFTRVETPYKGSYFTITVANSGEIVLGGMQGNTYRSSDQGKTFTKVDVPVQATISVSATLRDGTLVFVNQAGQILLSQDQGKTMRVVPAMPLPPTGAILEGKNGMLSVGVAGVIPFSISGSGAGKSGGVQ